MTKARIAIFAKAPIAGLAKTRLAPALGEAGAAALAARLLEHAVAQAVAADLGPVTIWATPDATHAAFQQLQQRHGVALAVQASGDLGARMAQVFEQELAADPHTPLLLMGADVPALDATLLGPAAAALHAQPAVFVPAFDGGYALVGLRAPLPTIFENMRWSTPQVMADTRARLAAAGVAHLELPAVHDIDEPADLAHLPPGWLGQGEQQAPGRSCPLHYRYAPQDFARAQPQRCETLYVVGGLYGNGPALQQVLELFEREPGTAGIDKRLVFNGDFNWFETEPAAFAALNETVLRHDALRGNVETELANSSGEAGCGCAYPEWVGDGVVDRSNRILARLRQTASAFPALTQRLAALPMWARFDVGNMRLGVVHGDAQSLAGWGFAQETLQGAAGRARARGWLRAAQVDAFACSHTCLPVFADVSDAQEQPRSAWVLNNGAAGMPNFSGDSAGLLTRVSLHPYAGEHYALRHGFRQHGVYVDALAVDATTPAWRKRFLAQWPPGSDAHASYGQRIDAGPDYQPEQALRSGATQG
jgi:rSAM/selenodomain-associated transferase 1